MKTIQPAEVVELPCCPTFGHLGVETGASSCNPRGWTKCPTCNYTYSNQATRKARVARWEKNL